VHKLVTNDNALSY